jgi:hypothetical protein
MIVCIPKSIRDARYAKINTSSLTKLRKLVLGYLSAFLTVFLELRKVNCNKMSKEVVYSAKMVMKQTKASNLASRTTIQIRKINIYNFQ